MNLKITIIILAIYLIKKITTLFKQKKEKIRNAGMIELKPINAYSPKIQKKIDIEQRKIIQTKTKKVLNCINKRLKNQINTSCNFKMICKEERKDTLFTYFTQNAQNKIISKDFINTIYHNLEDYQITKFINTNEKIHIHARKLICRDYELGLYEYEHTEMILKF